MQEQGWCNAYREWFLQGVYTVTIYPNPTEENQQLEIQISQTSFVSIALFDRTGKKVEDIFAGEMDKGDHNIQISTEKLSKGMYIYHIVIGENVYYRKTIKQ